MLHRLIVYAGLSIALLFNTGEVLARDAALFRTVSPDLPERGVLRLTSATSYAHISPNAVLSSRYAVTDASIVSSVTTVEYGILERLALTGTIPYCADMFSQRGTDGEKTGAGDISAGLRLGLAGDGNVMRGFSLGVRALIPEKLTYNGEPLGFREFSSGEFGYAVESGLGMRIKRLRAYLSAAYHAFPNAEKTAVVTADDVFYDTGFGYRGIGIPDARGFAGPIFEDQATVAFSGVLPLKSWFAIGVEGSATSFTGNTLRETITRVSPVVRFGREDGFAMSVGYDIGLSGPIPDRTMVLSLNVPTISPRGIRQSFGLAKKPAIPGEKIRAKNALVAVDRFTDSDGSFLYERALRESFEKLLHQEGVLRVVDDTTVDRAFEQAKLTPVADTRRERGVRLGAHYVINTDILDYAVVRRSRFTIPYIVGFPATDFTVKVSATVSDLVTGDVHDLGLITASVSRPRGFRMFPTGESGDIVYLSEPQRVALEKQLIDTWVARFNDRIVERYDLFDWDPKHKIVHGDEDTGG